MGERCKGAGRTVDASKRGQETLAADHLLPHEFGGRGGTHGSDRTRSEARDPIVRQVEYAPYPRARRGQRVRAGFTRDASATGMCLVVDHAEQPGDLLHIVVRGLDGRPALDSIARVVWCGPAHRDRRHLGLELLSGGRLLRVRPAPRPRVVVVTA